MSRIDKLLDIWLLLNVPSEEVALLGSLFNDVALELLLFLMLVLSVVISISIWTVFDCVVGQTVQGTVALQSVHSRGT